MDNNWKTMNIKREIFDLFDYNRQLFNDYYNGFEGSYTEQDIQTISAIINNIEHNIKNIREEIEYYE